MKYCGIDLHSNNCVVIVSDEEDRIVFSKRLPNDLGQIRAALEPHREELAGVVIESTYNWYWLVDGLMDTGYRVHLAHPSAIKKYEGLKHSGDFADAAYLAQLLRLGLLAEGYIYPREERGARDLARKRMQLVRYRTAQILSIENILMRQTGARMKGEAVKRLTAEQVDEFALCARCGAGRGGQPRGQPSAGTTNRSVGEAAQGTGELATGVSPAQDGAGHWRDAGDHDHARDGLASVDLPRWGNFSSYCRCVDSLRESNGKKKGEGNSQEREQVPGLGVCGGGELRPTLLSASQALSMIARRARRIASWRSRRWRTSWRGPATTCCATRSPSM